MTFKEYLDSKKSSKPGFFMSWTWTTDAVVDFFKQARLKRKLRKIIKQIKKGKYNESS